LSARKAGNLWRFEPSVDDITGLIISTEYNAPTSLSGTTAMVMARIKPLAINYPMIVNPCATIAVNATQIHSWWYDEIASIDPAQRNSDPPRGYISVVNESSQR